MIRYSYPISQHVVVLLAKLENEHLKGPEKRLIEHEAKKFFP